jgi:hypothetical protein
MREYRSYLLAVASLHERGALVYYDGYLPQTSGVLLLEPRLHAAKGCAPLGRSGVGRMARDSLGRSRYR